MNWYVRITEYDRDFTTVEADNAEEAARKHLMDWWTKGRPGDCTGEFSIAVRRWRLDEDGMVTFDAHLEMVPEMTLHRRP
jgi:hypothetical protein